MTIALGMLAGDGIVLADTQLGETEYLKPVKARSQCLLRAW
jgi:hypothetical protein